MSLIKKLFIGGLKYNLASFSSFQNQDIILVVEEKNGKVIKDNGYYFVHYLAQNKLLKDKVFLVVDKFVDGIPKSYQVISGSVKHYHLMRRLLFILFTHNVEYVFPVNLRDKLKLKHLVKSWHLQHGIFFLKKCDEIFKFFPANISVKYLSGFTEFDKSVADENGLIYMDTGLCRWDYLESTYEKKTVLYCPTWRRSNKVDKEKLISQMQDRIDYIHQAFDKTDYKLTIILHRYFCDMLNDKRITPVTDEISEYIRSHEILITDYSGIFSDFMVINKKVYLYAPDEDLFIKNDVGLFNRPSLVTSDEDFLLKKDIRLMLPLLPTFKADACQKTYTKLLELLE